MSEITLTQEGKDMIASRGWDKGTVLLCTGASETSVKVLTALSLIGKPFTYFELSFDDSPLTETKIGVKSKDYATLSNGYCSMPAILIEGKLYSQSDQIVKMLAEKEGASQEVLDLIDLSIENNGRLLEAAKHWGWSGLHKGMNYALTNADHYTSFGEGNKDEKWEAETGALVDAFFTKLENVLKAKGSVNGYFVGDELTFADCALLNWHYTFALITNLDIQSRYPLCAENAAVLKAKNPAGASYHYDHFPTFGGYVAGAMAEARARGFDINKVVPVPSAE